MEGKMVTIGDRIQEAIDYMDKGKIELALTPTCIALDITAQEYYLKNKSSGKNYKNFIQEYLWLITYMGLPGVLSNSLKIPFKHSDVKLDQDGFCSLEEIIYHVIRCGLIHGNGIDPKIEWNKIITLGLTQNGNLLLSDKLIWGLIGSIVFSEVNSNQKTGDFCWISIADFKFFINDIWGRIHIPKKIVKMYIGIEV
jgi:hypothetical protein